MKCYISSVCSSYNNIIAILDELRALGFRNIELTGNIEYCKNIDKIILRYRNDNKIDFIIHNYLPLHEKEFVLNLAATDVKTKSKTICHIKKIIDILKKNGKDLYSIHPGFKSSLVPILKDGFFVKNSSAPNKKDDFYWNIKNSLKYAISNNFKIAVENMHPRTSRDLYSFLCTPRDIKYFLNFVKGMPNIGILLDLGHLNVAAMKLKFDKFKILSEIMQNYRNKIFEIHISDNDGHNDSHDITQIDSWQIKFLTKYKNYLNEMPVVLEWHKCATKYAFRRFKKISEILSE